MTSFSIRLAAQTDLDALVAFNQGIVRETEDRELDEPTLRAGLAALLRDPSLGFYIVAETEGRVVGSLMVTREWSDWRNGVFWWIQSVYVSSDVRRQGIYRGLYQRIQEMAKSKNVCGFRLYVERDNMIAQHTYKELGMSETVYKMFEQPSDHVQN